MMARLLQLPLIVILMGISALAMLLPAAHGAATQDFVSMRAFFYSALILLIVAGFGGIATAGYQVRRQARSHLITLVVAYTLLPVLLAIPFHEAVRNTSFLNAYFEMVSAITTTGATLFDEPARLSHSVHLWRALVGWMGGFLAWVTAIAIMAPLSLGGFEVLASSGIGRGASVPTPIHKVADASERLTRYASKLFPIYAGLTLVLWIALLVLGDSAFVALCHAMSTMATSGISPVGGLQGEGAGSGYVGEALICMFLVFALSRQTFTTDSGVDGRNALLSDPEFRLGLALVIGLPILLFLRHWVGAYELAEQQDIAGAARALLGGVFMVMSFLTTAGFESAAWGEVRLWSGLQTPGLLLLGLAIFGGGVATTAGGVKLLRVYALYRHGQRELEKLVHPSSVGGSGASARRMRRQGAYVAWIFFMLFALSLAGVMLALALLDTSFQDAAVLSIAALSTTGPLASLASDAPISYGALHDGAKMILAATMVLGRLEMLVIIAFLNPAFWRQ
ncbi:MAG: TrkH family potassium uptake protein [Paracoccaceae bacterium]